MNAAGGGTDGLVVDFCSYEAARFAVTRWHYSRRMPRAKLVRIGAWEAGEFVGAVVFGYGATPNIGKPFGLDQTEVCELVRVALRRGHQAHTTAVVARALKLLRQHSPGLRLVVSFADTARGHHGGIYQAGNWVYIGGKEEDNGAYRVRGKIVHPRTLHSRFGKGGQSLPWLRANIDPNAVRIRTPVKHKYVMPLDRPMRRSVRAMAQPYPRAGGVGRRRGRPTSR